MGRAGGPPAGEGEHQGREGDQEGGQGLSNQAISRAGGPAAPNQPAQVDFMGIEGPQAGAQARPQGSRFENSAALLCRPGAVLAPESVAALRATENPGELLTRRG